MNIFKKGARAVISLSLLVVLFMQVTMPAYALTDEECIPVRMLRTLS